jgi:SAM-dependent methyltransferase
VTALFSARRQVILDLCCGAGGAAKGYHDAGFEVIGVDINPQPNYPYEFHQADALEFLGEALDRYAPFSYVDAIHASPPCQRWSSKTKDKEKHPDLITPLRPMLELTGVPYVMENVQGAPLNTPMMLCGSSFGLRVRRHRFFETNWPQPLRGGPDSWSCRHELQDEDKRFLLYDHGKWFRSGIVHVFGTGGGKGRDYWPSAMGCGDNWDECWMTPAELAEAIPPAYTEFVGKSLREWLADRHFFAEAVA